MRQSLLAYEMGCRVASWKFQIPSMVGSYRIRTFR